MSAKYLLRQILYQYVPKDLIERPKQGFSVPLESWLRMYLKAELLDLANDSTFRQQFELSAHISTVIHDFLDQKRYITPDFIWYLYNLKKWADRWL